MKDPYKKQERLRYLNPIVSREAIIKYLESRKSGSKLANLTKGMDKKAVRARIQAMVRDGQISVRNNKYYALPSEIVSGYLVIRNDGFGLIFIDGKDIILPPRQVFGLVRGDFIMVRITQKKIKGKFLGVLVDIKARGGAELVGEVNGDNILILPGQVGGDSIMLPDFKKLQDKQKVLVKIKQYPTPIAPGIVSLVKELSNIDDVRICAAMMHGLPFVFPEHVLLEANKLSMVSNAGRKDLRHLPFVTIDGADAKDFDDAVYVRAKDNGWILYVAIADVSAYVLNGSSLDEEAKLRATSVYFPGQVIPMLPEVLSNNLCSLLPNEDRAVMLAELVLDVKGNLETINLCRAVICSHARFTYDQVTSFIETSDLVPKFWQEPFKDLQRLCESLELKKQARGALSINRKEQVIRLDDNGMVISVELKASTKAHGWIELCMLEANEAVAKFMIKNKLPGIYREHGEPKPDKYLELLEILQNYNISPKNKEISAKNFQFIAKAISESDMSDSLMLLLLRSLPQATYTIKQLGHFGLAYNHYCHFTSPIRRYPDLWVHRVIGSFLDGSNLAVNDLSQLASHCSFAERRADYAAREVCQRYLCELMLNHIGKSFQAQIVSVHSFGFFVALVDSGIEGIVHVSNLPKDKYFYYEASNVLMGQFSGMVYSLGNKLEVLLQSVNVLDNKIEFNILK